VGFAGGVLLSLLLLQFAPQLATLCSGGAPVTSHLHQHAVIYLRIRLLALPAVVLSFASAGAYRGTYIRLI
jgi:Na+-driven multidrug efflux pump